MKISQFDLEEYFDTRSLADGTKKQYRYIQSAIAKHPVLKRLNIDEMPAAISYIVKSRKLKDPTKRNYIALWSAIYKHLNGSSPHASVLGKATGDLTRKLNARSSKNVRPPQPEEYKTYIEISDRIIVMMDEFLNSDRATSLDNPSNREYFVEIILMYMTVIFAPRRSDLKDIKLVSKDDQKENHYNTKTKMLFYKKFKRSDPIYIEVKDLLLIKALDLLAKHQDYIFPEYYRVSAEAPRRFSRLITKTFKNYFGVAYNIQKLRRLFSLRMSAEYTKLSNTAKAMGHTLAVHNDVYMNGSDDIK